MWDFGTSPRSKHPGPAWHWCPSVGHGHVGIWGCAQRSPHQPSFPPFAFSPPSRTPPELPLSRHLSRSPSPQLLRQDSGGTVHLSSRAIVGAWARAAVTGLGPEVEAVGRAASSPGRGTGHIATVSQTPWFLRPLGPLDLTLLPGSSCNVLAVHWLVSPLRAGVLSGPFIIITALAVVGTQKAVVTRPAATSRLLFGYGS